MTAQRIEVFKPSLGEDELRAVAEVFESGWIGLGPKTSQFEQEFAEYVGARHAIAVNSATAALHLACLVLDVGPGDEVLVPTITFVSTAHAPAYCGATPVFVDVDPETLNLDPADLKRKISPRSKAVIPVHFGGHASPMDEIRDLAKRHNLAVIEDAAHAAGSEYRGQRIGGLDGTDVTCFSFQAVKNLPVGDGGMITTNRDELVDRLRRLRWVGIDKSTWDRTEEVSATDESSTRRYSHYGWYYEVHELGYKYHMNDIAAAIGLVQLSKLDGANQRRRQIAQQYTDGLQSVEWFRCPVERPETQSCWHNYVIQSSYRDELNLFLRDKRIATGVHYMPLHLQPYYRSAAPGTLPVAEQVWTQLLTLPLYPELTDEQVQYIVRSVRSFQPPNEEKQGALRDDGRLRRIDQAGIESVEATLRDSGQRKPNGKNQTTFRENATP